VSSPKFLNDPEDVQWLFATHLKDKSNPGVQSFLIYGNEDAPERVIGFASNDPLLSDVPVLDVVLAA
jgi:hypothetical protein